MPPRGGAVAVVGARLVDVSIHGMAIESLVPLEPESVHRFRLVVEGRKVDLDVRVASCRAHLRDDRPVHGIGMEFLGMSPEDRQHLAAVLEPLHGEPVES